MKYCKIFSPVVLLLVIIRLSTCKLLTITSRLVNIVITAWRLISTSRENNAACKRFEVSIKFII